MCSLAFLHVFADIICKLLGVFEVLTSPLDQHSQEILSKFTFPRSFHEQNWQMIYKKTNLDKLYPNKIEIYLSKKTVTKYPSNFLSTHHKTLVKKGFYFKFQSLIFFNIFQFSETMKSWTTHCVKSVQIRSYFWSLFSCIRTEYGDLRSPSKEKYEPEITPYLDNFQAVTFSNRSL